MPKGKKSRETLLTIDEVINKLETKYGSGSHNNESELIQDLITITKKVNTCRKLIGLKKVSKEDKTEAQGYRVRLYKLHQKVLLLFKDLKQQEKESFLNNDILNEDDKINFELKKENFKINPDRNYYGEINNWLNQGKKKPVWKLFSPGKPATTVLTKINKELNDGPINKQGNEKLIADLKQWKGFLESTSEDKKSYDENYLQLLKTQEKANRKYRKNAKKTSKISLSNSKGYYQLLNSYLTEEDVKNWWGFKVDTIKPNYGTNRNNLIVEPNRTSKVQTMIKQLKNQKKKVDKYSNQYNELEECILFLKSNNFRQNYNAKLKNKLSIKIYTVPAILEKKANLEREMKQFDEKKEENQNLTLNNSMGDQYQTMLDAFHNTKLDTEENNLVESQAKATIKDNQGNTKIQKDYKSILKAYALARVYLGLNRLPPQFIIKNLNSYKETYQTGLSKKTQEKLDEELAIKLQESEFRAAGFKFKK